MTCCWINPSYNQFIGWFFGLVLTSLVLGCSFLNLKVEPIVATVTELSVCKGIDETGKPLGISEVFSTKDERIYVCGYLDTTQPIDLEIYWYHEKQLIFQKSGKNVEGYFYGFIQPKKGQSFAEGEYEIEVRALGTLAQKTQFRVEKP